MSARPFHRIAVTARSEFPEKERILAELVQVLRKEGSEVFLDPVHCSVPALKDEKHFEELKGFDLIIVLGGDGTVLRTVRDLRDFRIPLLTVNRGNVGFLAECDVAEMRTVLPSLLRGEGVIEERLLLSCSIRRNAQEQSFGIALNEVVVSQGAIARLIELPTKVNGTPLTIFRADGLIIATSTGSTAYSLSAGGPILHPTIEAIILTPINAYAFNQKPLVLPATDVIDVSILHRTDTLADFELSLTLDGQTHIRLRRGDEVTIQKHPEHVRFLRRPERTFSMKLRDKLKWGE